MTKSNRVENWFYTAMPCRTNQKSPGAVRHGSTCKTALRPDYIEIICRGLTFGTYEAFKKWGAHVLRGHPHMQKLATF